ncbi:MAG: hypothetical protein WA364_27870 [Candidatus Nitrosopolaris sp.]
MTAKTRKINISLNTYEKIGGNLMSAQNGQGPQIPILLLKEGTKETKGRVAVVACYKEYAKKKQNQQIHKNK